MISSYIDWYIIPEKHHNSQAYNSTKPHKHSGLNILGYPVKSSKKLEWLDRRGEDWYISSICRFPYTIG